MPCFFILSSFLSFSILSILSLQTSVSTVCTTLHTLYTVHCCAPPIIWFLTDLLYAGTSRWWRHDTMTLMASWQFHTLTHLPLVIPDCYGTSQFNMSVPPSLLIIPCFCLVALPCNRWEAQNTKSVPFYLIVFHPFVFSSTLIQFLRSELLRTRLVSLCLFNRFKPIVTSSKAIQHLHFLAASRIV